jgi:hypothetical protein
MYRALRTALFIALMLPARLAPQAVPHSATPASTVGHSTAHAPTDGAIDTMALRAYTYFLSGDVLEGRAAGSPGARAAALYIEAQLQRLGLEPAFNGHYRQAVPMARFTVDDEQTTVMVADTDTTAFRTGSDFVVYGGARPAFHDFAGSLVFLGLPQTALRESGRGGSLRGSVVVLIGLPGTAATRLIPDWVRRGAEGALLLVPDSAAWERFAASRSNRHYFVDARVLDPVWQPRLPMVVAGPSMYRRVMTGVPVDVAGLRGEKPFAPTPIHRRVRVHIQGTFMNMPGRNVGGVLPGRSAARRREYVAVTAHLDHLGIAPGLKPDSIYNGFSDNAAGVAMSLAIAGALRDDPPDRSVLFLYFTGEERGLLGSTYYTAAPAVPLHRTVGVVNLDAGAPPATSIQWRIAGGTISTLGTLADSIVRGRGWAVTLSDPSPNADYWPFLMHGVPAIFPIPEKNWEGVSPEQKQVLLDRFEHYHDPDDEWHADFPFVGLLHYATLAEQIVRAAAEAKPAPSITAP